MKFETGLEALKATAQAVRGGQTRIAGDLWPTDPNRNARLSHALKGKKGYPLTPNDKKMIVEIGKEHGVHFYMDYLCETMGYEKTQPVNEEKHRQELMEKILQNQEENKKMMELLVSNAPQIQAVS